MPDSSGAGERCSLTPEQRVELLQQVWELVPRFKPRMVADLLESLSEADLRAEPELDFRYAMALAHLGKGELALERLRRLQQRARGRVDARFACRLLLAEAQVLYYVGRMAETASRAAVTLAAASVLGDPGLSAHAANLLGVVASVRCQWDEAIAEFSRALIFYQQLGDPLYIGLTHHNQGMCYRELGLYSAADTQFEHAIAIMRPISEARVGTFEMERALLFHQRGDAELAAAAVKRAHAIILAADNPRQLGECLRIYGIVAAASDRERGMQHLSESLRLARETQNRLLEAEVQEELAVLYAGLGDEVAREAAQAEMERIYLELGAAARVERALARLHGAQAAIR